jgi:GTP cyclohydrolase I
MTTLEATHIDDIQSLKDERQLAISRVGVKSLRHPIRVLSRGEEQATIAVFDMYVSLAADQKGTHMSRFVELLESNDQALSLTRFSWMLQEMTAKLQANHGFIQVRFPFFMKKKAPVSGVESLMDYEISLQGEWHPHESTISLTLLVPVTSLCPCSKAISQYGAHNQRSHITVTVELNADIPFEQLIERIEAQASSELFGVLKRADEKYVTERAYENPKFVEDLVRDIARDMKRDPRIKKFIVESENFESIHNHSAYARIEG